MQEIGCRENIRAKLRFLTATERKAADYILSNYQKVLNCNISELAECAEVSDATVVRFCKKMGYKGYQDFKINAAKDMLSKIQHLNPQLSEEDNTETICKKIFHSEISVLKRTSTMLNIDDLELAADKIIRAGKVVFAGTGGSLLVGRDVQHKFMKVGVQIYVYEDIDMQLMSASLLDEGDVAFFISHSGTNKNVVDCMKTARRSKAFIISLVTKGKTPVSRMSDITIYTDSEENIFKSESISARIAQLAVLDVIVSMIALKKYEESYQAIQKTRKATSENKF
ncbi:MurR/RpiR family transcriptional regulator [Faecalicatena sp. AGMB00832]|uniref:MurR/RpiR family transcriptional regulator n=1 Tax=Faecalicatena faecalis TaxID=2726362 RepID=A0ABS6CY71_9FIRM|nr:MULTISPECIES: MurR/RpiR family transcriptional regulator [Faecalicatena]MBU3874280.1 MurR/RpiR family transcriptional regulator [Faecalicatena faecalis]MCI6464601.1 MurR/RpiR family transcriptional regulator [Faecalicatena sp.]MDY5620921.1 MurR/RpiR family transcriptional regulator [Lachnospiraceae bacterium]